MRDFPQPHIGKAWFFIPLRLRSPLEMNCRMYYCLRLQPLLLLDSAALCPAKTLGDGLLGSNLSGQGCANDVQKITMYSIARESFDDS